MRKLLIAFVMATLSILLAACSSSGSHPTTGSSSTAGSGGGATITISNFAYSGDLTVTAGEKVTVINKDAAPHTLTDKIGGKFDTGTINPGATGTFTAPTTPGTYVFGCRIHPEMKGTLIVKG